MNHKFDYVTNFPINPQQNMQTIILKPNLAKTNSIMFSPFPNYINPYQMQQAINLSQARLKSIQQKYQKMKKLMKMVSDRVGLDSTDFLEDKNDKWQDLQAKSRQNSIHSNSVSKTKKQQFQEQKAQILRKYNQASKQGMSLSRYCAENKLPERTVRRWITKR